MAKRFTDTALTRKLWFRKLTPKLKCAWRYLVDECDVAGCWSIDLDAMEFHVGERVGLEEMFGGFNTDEDRVVLLDDTKLLIVDFIEFQYGKLSEDCKPHKPVLKRVNELRVLKGYPKGFNTLQDKEKEKEKDKEKEKEKEREIENVDNSAVEVTSADLADLYKSFPRKEGKSKGLKTAKVQIKTLDDLVGLKTAIANYKANLVRKNTKPEFIMQFSTFMNQWQDWLDPEHGSAEDFSTRPSSNTQTDWETEARLVFEAIKKFSDHMGDELAASLGENRMRILRKAGGVYRIRQMPANEFSTKRLAGDLRAAYEAIVRDYEQTGQVPDGAA